MVGCVTEASLLVDVDAMSLVAGDEWNAIVFFGSNLFISRRGGSQADIIHESRYRSDRYLGLFGVSEDPPSPEFC
jgi:hypothetical protein